MTGSSKKTILLMDDSEIVLERLRGLFEQAGYAVNVALNLTELERERARASPDLIVLDVQMPEAFGDDVACVLRDVRKVAVPIILYSSLDPVKLGARAREAEIEWYLSKSDGVEPLLARVESLLGPATA